MTIKCTPLIVTGMSVLALALSSCGGTPTATTTANSSDAPASTTPSGVASSSPATTEAASSAPAGTDLTVVGLAAIATAEAVEDGRAYSIDDLDSDGTWEVDVLNGTTSVEYDISADGSTVLATDPDNDDDDSDERAALESATVTISQAISTAVEEGGLPLDDAEFDTESGSWAWEVSLQGRSTDIVIDPATGAVLSS